MNSKVAVVASVAILVAGSWWWIARDSAPGLPEAEDATGVGEERHERRADSKREASSRKPSPPDPSRRRTAPESGSLESEVPRSGSRSEGIGVTLEGRERGRRARAVDAGDPGEAVHDGENAGGSEELGRSGQKLGALGDGSHETPGDDPIEPDAAELSPEDLERIDLDGDGALSAWELATARRLRDLAERYPVKNDLYDGAYPVEREDYAKREQEFDWIDTRLPPPLRRYRRW